MLPGTYTGTFRVGLHVDTNGYSCIASAQGNQFLPDSWTALDLDVMIDDTMANGVSAASTCYNSNVFTAQEDNCYVKVTSHVQFFNDHKCNNFENMRN